TSTSRHHRRGGRELADWRMPVTVGTLRTGPDPGRRNGALLREAGRGTRISRHNEGNRDDLHEPPGAPASGQLQDGEKVATGRGRWRSSSNIAKWPPGGDGRTLTPTMRRWRQVIEGDPGFGIGLDAARDRERQGAARARHHAAAAHRLERGGARVPRRFADRLSAVVSRMHGLRRESCRHKVTVSGRLTLGVVG
ncbi:MAG: hypothetical protein OXI95_09640, partial [bacterium]|nr:hypothetical protein [bacterium]MDE0417182.1 hypothetical protein [bacterium]